MSIDLTGIFNRFFHKTVENRREKGGLAGFAREPWNFAPPPRGAGGLRSEGYPDLYWWDGERRARGRPRAALMLARPCRKPQRNRPKKSAESLALDSVN